MREEQKEEEQDKMPGKDSSLRRVRKCFKKIRGRGQGAKEKELTPCWAYGRILFLRQHERQQETQG